MQSPAHVRLHPARVFQLKALADFRGLPITELLETLISKELAEEPLFDRIPDLHVIADDGLVSIEVGGLAPIAATPLEAMTFSLYVEKVLEGPDNRGGRLRIQNIDLLIGRRGRGVIVKASAEGKESTVTLTTTLARDLKRQLDRAAEFLCEIHGA